MLCAAMLNAPLVQISFLPACVILWHNYFALKPNCCCACCQPGGCGKLCSKQHSNPTAIQRKAVRFCVASLLTRLVASSISDTGAHVQLTAGVELASVHTGGDSTQNPTAAVDVADPPSGDASKPSTGESSDPPATIRNDSDAHAKVERRMLERFFMGPFSDFIINPKARVAIFICFALWLIPVIIFATQGRMNGKHCVDD